MKDFQYIQIIVEYNDKKFYSKVIDANPKEADEILKLISDATNGKRTNLEFDCDNNTRIYFSKEILSKSIISIITKNK